VTQELIIIWRLFLAAFLGGLVGLERESVNKAAGLRTHTLVALGACLIMLTSVEIFKINGPGTDSSRIAAQVVSGIGFLGAGTIMRSSFGIKGLTTAASLWIVAAIGLAVGLGSYLAAITATGIVFIVLLLMPQFESRVKSSPRKYKTVEIIMADQPGQLGLVSTTLGKNNINIRKVNIEEVEGESIIRVVFSIILPYYLKEEEVSESLRTIRGIEQVRFIEKE
jgi:putative Mg2+ transporter-C (MgtC) family protein